MKFWPESELAQTPTPQQSKMQAPTTAMTTQSQVRRRFGCSTGGAAAGCHPADCGCDGG